jgi:hypothetical protein
MVTEPVTLDSVLTLRTRLVVLDTFAAARSELVTSAKLLAVMTELVALDTLVACVPWHAMDFWLDTDMAGHGHFGLSA